MLRMIAVCLMTMVCMTIVSEAFGFPRLLPRNRQAGAGACAGTRAPARERAYMRVYRSNGCAGGACAGK